MVRTSTKALIFLLASLIYVLGVYVGDNEQDDQELFVTEKCCFSDLLKGLSTPCSCGLTMKPWVLDSVVQVANLFGYIWVNDYQHFWFFRKGMSFVLNSSVDVVTREGHGPAQECLLAIT